MSVRASARYRVTHRLLWKLRRWRRRYLAGAPPLTFDLQGAAAGARIQQLLSRPGPTLVARFGQNELQALVGWRATQDQRPFLQRARAFVRAELGPWWWDERNALEMERSAGFFPFDDANRERFARRMLQDCAQVDLLGSWLQDERLVADHLAAAARVPLADLEPYLHADPWSEALAGRRVLVIHPFAASIQRQYQKRRLLFSDPRVLPEFELLALPAVQTIGRSDQRFGSWFEALEFMEEEVARLDFDVAIIGAGAYGLPLGAHCKRLGRKAVHLGGATQILFGIRGRRWDAWPAYQALFNEHWTRPLAEETPRTAREVEGGCYW